MAQKAPLRWQLERQYRIPLSPVWVAPDSQTIVQATLQAQTSDGQPLMAAWIRVDNNLLRFDTAAIRGAFPTCDTLQVRYRSLSSNLLQAVQRLDTAALRRQRLPGSDTPIEFDYTPYEPNARPWESGNLLSSGAYTRGFSLGNNQNLVFNSKLNLQLNGRLGNDLELQAALADNSVPLQPDGSTRQLQEFDRIFIRLKRKGSTLTAGDFDLVKPRGYFANYFKRLQGAALGQTWQPKARDTVVVQLAAAVSRGKFARQLIPGREGNQGPYRLQGAEGERFIIVLAGTEKVFIDGQLLRRGLADDYVIDYNLGEITFMPRRLITKDIRIIVEFEYAVQTYLRSTSAMNLEWHKPIGTFYLNYYAEQDSRNGGGAQELTPEVRRRLAEVGDQLSEAYASGIDTLAQFESSRILYRSIDTIICGTPYNIMVYSTQPDSARYSVRFSEVPQGQGNYIVQLSAANGRVYRWVAPDPVNCQPQGNFEPIVRLLAPEQKHLYGAGAQLNLKQAGGLQAEVSLSKRDLNRFSPLGDADNLGAATFLRHRVSFGEGSKYWRAQFQNAYEYTARTYRALNPYRPPEFSRDWNVPTTDTLAEQWWRSSVQVERKKTGVLRYEFNQFSRSGTYLGTRHFSNLQLQHKGWALQTEINRLDSRSPLEQTAFTRPKADLSYTISRRDTAGALKPLLKTGFYAEREKNARSSADSLNRSSFWYDLYRFYVQMPESNRAFLLNGHLSRREDFFPEKQKFTRNTIAEEVNVNGLWRNNTQVNQQLTFNISARKLYIERPDLSDQKAQQTYLGRIDYSLAAWKNALNLSTGYELGSGQSPKLEYNYVRVNPGEGQYSWIDRNRDSILQIDEMELAVFQDQASYVRVAVSSTEYVRTNNVVLSQNLRFEPRLLRFKRKNIWTRAIKKTAVQQLLQINRRSFAEAAGVSVWNPFQRGLADTALVANSFSSRNTLFINRANPAWDIALSQGDLRNQVALTTGFERRRNTDVNMHLRVNLGRRWSSEADFIKGMKESDNQVFNARDYRIDYWRAGPKLTWLPLRSFRLQAQAGRQQSRNVLGAQETALQDDVNLELNWNPAPKLAKQGFKPSTSLRIKGKLADVRYSGTLNTPVAFTMLEGLSKGRNYLWTLGLDRQLSKSMQLNLSYEGRKTGENRIIHVGRAQVRAVF